MIIIKTANGDRFVNEAETLMVIHDKEIARVTVHPKSWSNEYSSPFIIENVESVIYATADQLGKYEDKGSQVEKLQKELSKQLEWGSNIREKYMEMELECDQLKERLAELEPQPKDYENDLLRDTVFNEMERIATEERELQRRIHPEWGMKSGNGVRFLNIAHANEIETVGQLLSVGRARFEKFKYMGSKCADDVSKALENLYGIKQW